MSGVTPLTILNDSSIAARTSAQLCNKVTRLTPSRTCGVRMSPWNHDMWPPSSPNWYPVNYTIWVVLHFLLYAVYICQKSLNFTYAFKCYQQNCSWFHFTWPTLYAVARKNHLALKIYSLISLPVTLIYHEGYFMYVSPSLHLLCRNISAILLMLLHVVRWQALRTDSNVRRWATWTIVWVRLSTRSVWQTRPKRSGFWRVWARCRWTVQHTPAEHWALHPFCRRVRGYSSHGALRATSTLPWQWRTWSSMTWTLHSPNFRLKRRATTWPCMHSDLLPHVLQTGLFRRCKHWESWWMLFPSFPSSSVFHLPSPFCFCPPSRPDIVSS